MASESVEGRSSSWALGLASTVAFWVGLSLGATVLLGCASAGVDDVCCSLMLRRTWPWVSGGWAGGGGFFDVLGDAFDIFFSYAITMVAFSECFVWLLEEDL